MTNLVTRQRPNTMMSWPGFRDLEDRINRMFGDYPHGEIANTGAWMPAVDVNETDDAYELKADLPGLKPEDIDLSVTGDVVTLKGQRAAEEWTQDEGPQGYRRIERSSGSFQRAFRVPEGVDANKVQAQFENGVLHVTLPKSEATRPKQIAVSTG